MKTSWSASTGRMIFLLPDRSQYETSAVEVDRPITLCELIDVAAEKLTAGERRALAAMLTQLDNGGEKPKGGLR